MSASPPLGPPVPSRGATLASFRHVDDERGFEKLPSVIPDSQAMCNTGSNPIHIKRFSVPKDEVSISNISEGFSFGEKKPPRPGQFSQRPKVEHSQSSGTSKFFSSSMDILPRISPPEPLRAPITQIPRPPPLDLPEIGLVGKQSSTRGSPASSRRGPVGTSDRREHNSSRTPQEEPSPRRSVAAVPAKCSESPELTRRDIAPITSILAPSKRTKAFSSSPRPAEVIKQVGTSRLTEEKNPVFVPPSDLGSRFEHLKLPLPSITRNDPTEHRVSPRSPCGDLETPAPQTPRTARRNRASRHHRSRKPTPRSYYHKESERLYGRSESRASNISKKRLSRRKPRSQPAADPDRKKLAMQNMAEQWNECIQISEAERNEAVQEIVRLEDEVHCAEQALERSKQLLSEKDATIQRLTDLHNTRKEKGSLAKEETQRLLGEVESLRSELAKSREDKASIHEKYRKHRAKLNEAIREQQNLFVRARSLCDETNAKLQEEKEKRAVDVEAVESALEASRKKREELKSCVEKYQAEAEKETQKKNHTIEELKTKLEHQQHELVREREAASELQAQLKTESTLTDMIKNMHSDLCSLKENSDKYNEWKHEQDRMTECLSKKLNHINDHLESHIDSQVVNEEVKVMVENLEANIITRVASEIHKVISAQTDSVKTAACFEEAVQSHFEKLHHDIAEQQSAHSKNKEWHEEIHQVLVGYLDSIATRTLETHKACEEMKNDWADFSASDSAWKNSLKDDIHSRVIKQLQDRESKIVQLERMMLQVSHEWSQKFDVMRSSIHDSGQQAKTNLQGAIREIREALDKTIQEQSVASQDDISKSETIRTTIEAHLQQVRLQLEAVSSGDSESQLLREALVEERKKTSDLQEQLANLQDNADISDELCRRERQDLNAIEALKSQLESISERMPRVENLNTTFNKMIDLNQILQSTAFYLTREHSWVKGQLSAKQQAAAPHKLQENEIETGSAYCKEQHLEEAHTGFQAQVTGTKHSNSLDGLSTLDVHTQGDRYRRKVVVASPALEASSPAPAPSIAQEQQRRREPIFPRPILRSAAALLQESEVVRTAVSHDRYNRPVMARASSAAGGADPAMLEQIRSGMVEGKSESQKWYFPTMDDFAKESVLGGRKEAKLNKQRNIGPADDEGSDITPATKKIKLENQQEAIAHAGTVGM